MLTFVPFVSQLDPCVAAVAGAVIVVAVVAAVLVIRRQIKSPRAAADGSAVRHGTKEASAADITAASLFFVPWLPDATQRSLTITLAGPDGLRATVGLRKRGRLVLTHAETAVLVALISRSSIQLPRDKDDPRGRFSRVLYPTHLTKADALTVVEHPPGDGEPLPIGIQRPT